MCRSAGQSVGDCPELAAKLQVFTAAFFSSLPSEDRGATEITFYKNSSPEVKFGYLLLTTWKWVQKIYFCSILSAAKYPD